MFTVSLLWDHMMSGGGLMVSRQLLLFGWDFGGDRDPMLSVVKGGANAPSGGGWRWGGWNPLSLNRALDSLAASAV